MSDLLPPEADPDGPLQFDQAEYKTEIPGRLTCAVCNNEIENLYYEFNGMTVCDSCQVIINGHWAGGSGLLRFAKASLLGTIAAFAGFAIYFGIQKTMGMQIGLIAILVGYMVGTAVRSGSGQRGGWIYQGLAILLTYAAISASYAATYLPVILAERVEGKNANHGELTDKPEAERNKEQKPVDAEKELPPPERQPLKAADLSNPILLLSLIIISLSLPIVVGLSSPIGLLIVGFALWEAWKLNRHVPLVFNGPFSFGGESAPPPTEVPSHA
ncbi:hypothetical protein Sinac_6151 [Singulisphaera acidiphila DSM 18658]|uniref:Uncharacterized protein n=2 Tax=Singulisphaera acidiphila TaxID=466153 RepID=L0DN35_SINAD|nr:hypothetical protein Sinac_6151 [Singulisphaera acidiphila DSM 18658]